MVLQDSENDVAATAAAVAVAEQTGAVQDFRSCSVSCPLTMFVLSGSAAVCLETVCSA